MFSILDKNKFIQLGLAIFGVFSVYVIHSVIYEKLIMTPFLNSQNNTKQFFQSEAGFVFLQKVFAWILVEIFAYLFLKKQTKVSISNKLLITGGLFAFLSSILFTTGIFQLSYRISFSNRSSTYLIATIVGYIICPYTSPSKTPRFRDIFSGIGIGFGVIIFWICGQDLWIYTPTKNGYIYNWMVVTSGLCDGILSLVQARISEKYQPNEVQLLLNVSRCTAIFSFLYVSLIGQLRMTVQFCLSHHNWTLSVFSLAALYFVGQLFVYRIAVRMAQNIPAFVTTSRRVLTVHQSYALSSHRFHKYQIFGMIISWVSIIVQIFLFSLKQSKIKKQFSKIPHHEIQIGYGSSDIIEVENH